MREHRALDDRRLLERAGRGLLVLGRPSASLRFDQIARASTSCVAAVLRVQAKPLRSIVTVERAGARVDRRCHRPP